MVNKGFIFLSCDHVFQFLVIISNWPYLDLYHFTVNIDLVSTSTFLSSVLFCQVPVINSLNQFYLISTSITCVLCFLSSLPSYHCLILDNKRCQEHLHLVFLASGTVLQRIYFDPESSWHLLCHALLRQ